MKSTFQVRKMRISQKENRVFRIHHQQNENLHRVSQIECHQKMKNVDKCQKNTKFCRFCQLQLQIHQEIFTNRKIIH